MDVVGVDDEFGWVSANQAVRHVDRPYVVLVQEVDDLRCNCPTHFYMKKMGLKRTFFLNCELVNDKRPLDYEFSYEDNTPVKPGDYYYLRAEQITTDMVWSSPVWID